jgi:YfiH family protein
VHGDAVVRVRAPGDGAGTRADASVTDQAGCALAVLTADCAPVVLASREGPIGVAHAGWAGAAAGVLQRAVKELRDLGATHVAALVGPCIHAECYEFGGDDLARLADRYGNAVIGRTSAGRPALDLVAAVRAALAEADVDEVDDVDVCTSCSSEHYSWRARRESERQAAVVWRDAVSRDGMWR